MFHHRRRFIEQLGAVGFGSFGKRDNFLRDLLFGKFSFANKSRHFDDIDWPDAGGEDVLSDLGVHPRAPFLSALFTDEVGRAGFRGQARDNNAGKNSERRDQ